MFDALGALRADEAARRLLGHYAALGEVDREAWQDRVMELDRLPPDALVRLHGSLLAQEWVEQNTSVVSLLQAGAVRGCYRITAAGRRALRRALAEEDDEEMERTA